MVLHASIMAGSQVHHQLQSGAGLRKVSGTTRMQGCGGVLHASLAVAASSQVKESFEPAPFTLHSQFCTVGLGP